MGTAVVPTVLLSFHSTGILLFIYFHLHLFAPSFELELEQRSSHPYTFDSLIQYSIHYPRSKYTFFFPF